MDCIRCAVRASFAAFGLESSEEWCEDDLRRDYEVLYAMVEGLGNFPRAVARSNREFFTRDGQFRHPVEIRTRPLSTILSQDYGLAEGDARDAAQALLPMLRYNTTRRVTASACMQMKFFGGSGRRSESRKSKRKKRRQGRRPPRG